MNTPTTTVVPVFERDFNLFLAYLNHAETPTSISPKRYAQVLRIDIQTLAARARVHHNTVHQAPETESVQRYLRQSLCVIRAASDRSGNVEKPIFWFKNTPLPAFDYKTAQDLVSDGRANSLIRYLQSLESGFAG